MRNIIESLRNVGATESTINFFIVVFIIVIALILIGSFVIAGIMLLQGLMPPNWLTGIITALIGAVVVLISVASQTQHINGTAAKAAGQTAANLQPALTQAAQSGQVNAETLQQIMQSIMALQSMSQQTMSSQQSTISTQANAAASSTGDTQANTQAVIQNTQATQENTQQGKEHFSHG